jgi:two-component system CheB/CheR fusion protein
VSEYEKRFSQLIVIGASAGGIEALSATVSKLSPDLPAPIVVAQHISPSRISSLADILARRGSLPVRTVVSQEAMEPGVIYVVPPNRDVMITDHEVRVHADDAPGPRPSIDLLFRSAAEIFRDDLIAVVLSGTGSDGADGARTVKQLGGTVVIQNPETASFPGMPLSLAPSNIDIVANPESIGPLLHDLLTGVFTVPKASEDNQFRSFLDQLRDESGIDFSTYKQATISRRLQRRMAATGQTTLGDYVRYLHNHPEERQRLVGSFLIKVTEFFRDPELYQYLRDQVLPELIAEAIQRGTELRFWSAGCATGEEAYSLAIIVADLLDAQEGETPQVRIFATDLDAEAVSFARRGVYPARTLLPLPQETIDRYFIERDGEYEVRKALRSMLVFGEHDLGQRAPFPRIDLILCRNVLIYFTAALQRRALQLFAFSLRGGGYLVLGKSETVSPLAEYFALDQSRLKVFRRVGDRALIPPGRIKEAIPLALALPPNRPLPQRPAAASVPRNPRMGRDLLRGRVGNRTEAVLLGLPSGVVVVDQNYDVQSINAAARRMLGIHSTAVEHDFLHMLQHIPIAALRRAIDRAIAGETPEDLFLTTEGDPPDAQRTFRISCFPAPSIDEHSQPMAAISVIDATELHQSRQSLQAAERLAQRLASDNEEVLAANLELTGTISKLRAENDDLLVGAEEMQAATEEVETLNEELQASNEELETLNEELQATVEELNTTNDDLQARTLELQSMAIASESARSRLETVLSSISDAVLVVDERGQAILTNPAYEQMFGGADIRLIPEGNDGRPLPASEHPQVRAARGETFSLSFTITAPDGSRRWYEAESHPVPNDVTRLGVITIRDITERNLRHLQDQWLAIAGHELRTPVAALQGYLQLTLRDSDVGENRTLRNRIERALGQVTRISQLVDQMVDATRFQFGRISFDFQPIDLSKLVTEAVSTASQLRADAAIEVHHDGTPVLITGDAGRLEQVILNLLSNAILHSQDGVHVEVSLTPGEHEVALVIHDNGPGISGDMLPTVFERFSRGGGSQAGLGLGLFIVREIVTAHGGTIDIASTPDAGTTATVSLPTDVQLPVEDAT